MNPRRAVLSLLRLVGVESAMASSACPVTPRVQSNRGANRFGRACFIGGRLGSTNTVIIFFVTETLEDVYSLGMRFSHSGSPDPDSFESVALPNEIWALFRELTNIESL